MLLADEALILSSILAVAATMLMVFVGALFLFRRPLMRGQSRLGPSWRLRCAAAALAITLAYLFHGADLAPRMWFWVAVGVTIAMACTTSAPQLGGLLRRGGWVLFTWHALVASKFTALPVQTPAAGMETSRLLLFNFCQALLYPPQLLSEHYALPGVAPFLEAIVEGASQFATVALIATISLTNIGVIWAIDVILGHDGREPPSTRSTAASRRWLLMIVVIAGVSAMALAAMGLGDEKPSMRLAGLFLLVMLTLPLVGAELVANHRRQRSRWMWAGLLQLGLGGLSLAGCFPDWFRLLGLISIFTGSAVVTWRGLALLLLRPDGRLRLGWAALCLLVWFNVPVVALVALVAGVIDIAFDIRSLALFARRPGRDIPWRSPKPVMLSTLAGVSLMLLWCAVVAACAYSTLEGSNHGSLRPPSETRTTVSADPWLTTERVCTARGERPCQAREVSCDPDSCAESLFENTRFVRAMICYPDDDGLGRLYTEFSGFLPQWPQSFGTVPRQFGLPRDARSEDLFADHRLFIYCCPLATDEPEEASTP